MDQSRRILLVDRYKEAVEAILISLDDLSAAELDYKPANAGWSARELLHHLFEFVRPPSAHWTARQVIHHLADAELSDAVRLRRMLQENTPVLHTWGEGHEVHLHYDRPIKLSIQVFNAVANSNIEILRLLDHPEWERSAHEERPWPITVEVWLERKVVALHRYLMQILNAVGAPKREDATHSPAEPPDDSARPGPTQLDAK